MVPRPRHHTAGWRAQQSPACHNQAGRPGRSRRGCVPLDTFFGGLFFNPRTIKVTLPEHTVQWFSVYSQGWETTPNSRPFHPPGGGNQRAWPPPPTPAPPQLQTLIRLHLRGLAHSGHFTSVQSHNTWLLRLSSVTEHVFKAHSCCSKPQDRSLPRGRTVFYRQATLCAHIHPQDTLGLFPPPRSSEQSCCGHLRSSFCVDVGFVSPRSPLRAEQPGPLLAPRLLFGGAAGLSSRCAHPRQPQTRILINTGYRLSTGDSQPSGCEMVSPWSSDLHFPES